jgi:hypothetical protein
VSGVPWVRLALAVGFFAAAGGAVGLSCAEAASADGCAHVSHAVGHSSAVVVWYGHGELDACVRATGAVHPVANTRGEIDHLVVAGDYVGFQVVAGEQLVYLDVFDVLSARTEVSELLISCPGDGCPEATSPWQLAPSGWVAYVGEYGTGELLATDGRRSTRALDDGPHVGDLRLSGSTLSWSSGGAARYSAPLDASLSPLVATHAAPPRPLPTACSLITPTDAEAILGVIATASSGDSCTYTDSAVPTSTLTVTLLSSLSPAQVTAAKQLAYSREREHPEEDLTLGPPDYHEYDWWANWETSGAGLNRREYLQLTGNVELTVEVVIATPPGYNQKEAEFEGPQIAGGPWRSDTVATHLLEIASDRLMGWHVRSAEPSSLGAMRDRALTAR